MKTDDNDGIHLRTIPSTVGVKQGDNLAPVLFVFFINAVAQSIEEEWNAAEFDVPWFSHYFEEDVKGKEVRCGHDAQKPAKATLL